MKLKVISNIDFLQLANRISRNISDGTRRIIRSAEKGAKERIDKGLYPPLRQSTIQLRKERGTGGTKPLYETGALYRSIKSTDEGLEMLEYGWYHEKGYTVKNVPIKKNKQGRIFFHGKKKIQKKVPARPFIMPSQKEILEPMKKLYMDMKKALTTPLREVHRG